MQSQTIEIFPTILKRYDVSDIVYDTDVQAMVSDIDLIHQDFAELMWDKPEVPKYQCKPLLWDQNFPFIHKSHWSKLRKSFVQSVNDFNQTVKGITQYQETIQLLGTRAWFFKSRKEDEKPRGQAKHNHRPAYLSGVFYLRIPGDLSSGGTNFYDPRGQVSSLLNPVIINPISLTWIIFPGWLDHTASLTDSAEWRYTIAADCYVGYN